MDYAVLLTHLLAAPKARQRLELQAALTVLPAHDTRPLARFARDHPQNAVDDAMKLLPILKADPLLVAALVETFGP